MIKNNETVALVEFRATLGKCTQDELGGVKLEIKIPYMEARKVLLFHDDNLESVIIGVLRKETVEEKTSIGTQNEPRYT